MFKLFMELQTKFLVKSYSKTAVNYLVAFLLVFWQIVDANCCDVNPNSHDLHQIEKSRFI